MWEAKWCWVRQRSHSSNVYKVLNGQIVCFAALMSLSHSLWWLLSVGVCFFIEIIQLAGELWLLQTLNQPTVWLGYLPVINATFHKCRWFPENESEGELNPVSSPPAPSTGETLHLSDTLFTSKSSHQPLLSSLFVHPQVLSSLPPFLSSRLSPSHPRCERRRRGERSQSNRHLTKCDMLLRAPGPI